MNKEFEWGIWIAVAALITSMGNFLDKYHIQESTKGTIRSALILAFIYIQKPQIPNFAQLLVESWKRLTNRFRIWGIIGFIVFGYWAIASTFYAGRIWIGSAPKESYIEYVITLVPLDISTIFWLVILGWVIGIGLLALYLISQIFSRINRTSKMLLQLGWSFLSLIVVFFLNIVGAYGSRILGDGLGIGSRLVQSFLLTAENPLFSLFLTFGLFLPSYILALSVLLLVLTRTLIETIRTLLLNVFDVASDPKNSPFTYGFGILGIGVLLLKLLQEMFH